jgi:hypothetical protein
MSALPPMQTSFELGSKFLSNSVKNKLESNRRFPSIASFDNCAGVKQVALSPFLVAF